MHYGKKIFLRFLDDYSRYEIRYSEAQQYLEAEDAWLTISSSDPDNIQFSFLLKKEKLDSILSENIAILFKKANVELLRKNLLILGESTCEDLISLILTEQQERRQIITGSRDRPDDFDENPDIDFELLQRTLRKILGPYVAASILRSIENDILR